MRIKNTPFTKIIFILFFMFVLLFVNTQVKAEENHSPGLFTTAGINELTAPLDDLNKPNVIRSRLVRVNFDQLCRLETMNSLEGIPPDLTPINLNLFNDVNITVRFHEVEKTFSGGTSYVGYIDGIPWGEVVMVKTEGILSATINTVNQLYIIRYAGGDLHYIKEIRPGSVPQELPPVPVDLQPVDEKNNGVLDTGNYIDIMVLYTPAARAAEGGTTAMKNTIDLAITETNNGYNNSAVTQRLRLVHTAEVSYDESGFDWDTALGRLQDTNDGYMDNVPTLRNTYGADEVALIVNADDYCGMGYLMTSVSSSFEAYAFCLVSRECVTGYYSLAHELGHNMGSHHDRDNASTQGVYNYSYGYQAPNEAFRTIMAYDCPSGCPRVNYWSNPGKIYGGQVMGVDSTAPLAADNHKSLNNTLSTVRNFRQAKGTSAPKLSLNRTKFYFGAIANGSKTAGQTLRIDNGGTGTLTWSISESVSWLSVSRTSGSGAGVVTLNVNPTNLAVGTYTGAMSVSASGASSSPQTVNVTLTVKNSNSDQLPFGEFSSPVHGSYVSSSIAVTGWVLDDVDVSSVKIYNGTTYVGDAIFVEGARPDVATAYSTYPKNYQAGWGYMLLTHFLPNGGNGTYKLYAKVTDSAGHVVTLGSKTIYCNNANAVKPFGAIDTPTQGGNASGSSFVNSGWVLTPQPNMIPTNGSTIEVYIDSVKKGTATYNLYRSDIATLFPSYENSSGAAASFKFNTNNLKNGVHTIFWIVTDDDGNADGVGSRFFIVQNIGADMDGGGEPACSPVFDPETSLSPYSDSLPIPGPITGGNETVTVTKGFRKDAVPQTVHPDNGSINVTIQELERVVIDFGTRVQPVTSLPIGSTLDSEKGIFYWNPGPGFIGNYQFVFTGQNETKQVKIKILPKQ